MEFEDKFVKLFFVILSCFVRICFKVRDKSANISTTFFLAKIQSVSINTKLNADLTFQFGTKQELTKAHRDKSQNLVFHHFFIENFFHMTILQLFQWV